jgi:activator of HSP90 ATPase
MKTIKKLYKIAANRDQVWEALVNPEIIDKWGGGPAKMESKIGFQFQLWGGDIYGKNIEVEKEKKLVQEWFGGNWQKPSIVTFTLKSEDKNTILELEQVNVPDEEADDVDQGWDEYYLNPMKKMLEKNK